MTSRTPDDREVLGGGDPEPSGPEATGARRTPPRPGDAPHGAEGDSSATQNAGMGWDPAEATRTPYSSSAPRAGFRADDGRPIALGYHTGHGGGPSGPAARRGDPGGGPAAVRGELHRPLRRPHAGHARGDGQPAFSATTPAVVMRRQNRSLPRRAGVLGHRDLRQGAFPPRCSRLAAPRPCRADRPRGGDAPRRRQREPWGRADAPARASPTASSPSRKPLRSPAGVRLPGRRLSFPSHGRHRAGGGRGAGLALPQARSCRRGSPVARHGPPLALALYAARRALLPTSRIPDRPVGRERDGRSRGLGGSTNLVLHLPGDRDPPPASRVPTVADWQRVNRAVPAPRGRPPELPAQPPDRAQCSPAGGVPEFLRTSGAGRPPPRSAHRDGRRRSTRSSTGGSPSERRRG